MLKDTVGETKYLPPASREWTNNIYNYNVNNVKNYPVHNLNINTLIKGYFSMYFNNKFLTGGSSKKIVSSLRNKRVSLNKIFVSKAEVKHTNSKAIITIYVYNRERLILLKKIKLLKLILTKFILIQTKLISQLNMSSVTEGANTINNKLIDHLLDNYKMKTKFTRRTKDYSKKIITREISTTLFLLRKCMLKLHLNKSKFEENFLFKLSNYISKYYDKKVEFNIVNLKHISKNADIFTEIFMLKMKKGNASPLLVMRKLLNKIKIKQVMNPLLERGRVQKTVNYDLVENKFKNKTLSLILSTGVSSGTPELSLFSNKDNKALARDGVNKILNDLYLKDSILVSSSDQSKDLENISESKAIDNFRIRDIVLDNIKYKETGGVKLEVKGRLTKRYRADRALYKFKWKGGLKNIDSAFKGLRTVVYRGFMDANVEKSLFVSKRRIGSFAVKGWLSRK